MIDDVEAPDLRQPRAHMTPRHAYNVAMEAEIKAYNFFNDALSGIEDQNVRKLFEELRDEELEHQHLLEKLKNKFSDNDLDPYEIDTQSL